jgi:hypothetical protein
MMGGLYYNTFAGLADSKEWIEEDLPISSNQPIGAHIIDKRRTVGIIGNIAVSLVWRKYDT